MGDYGIVSLVPVIVVLIVALITRKVFEPLFLGSVVGFIILSKQLFVQEWLNAIYAVLADPTFGWIVMVTALFGGLVLLIEKSGGAEKFSDFASNYVKSRKGSLIMTWLLGIVVFIDDYLNTLVVGTAMRNLTDKHKVPREMLAYVLKSTSSPLAIVTPFSTWAVFMAGLIAANGINSSGTAISTYMQVIPFNVYGFVALLLVPLVIIGIIPKLGGMKKAYERVDTTGEVFPADEKSETEVEKNNDPKAAKLYFFFAPLLILVAVTIIFGSNLVYGILAGLATCAAIYISHKAMTFTEFMDTFFEGVKSMVTLIALMLMAFVLVRANEGLGLTNYVVNLVQPLMSGAFLPAITFITVGLLGFCTGSFWGVSAIIMPIIIPLAQNLDANVYLAIGSVISGAVLGSHTCFFADSLFLASFSTQIRPMTIALSMLPYVVIAAILSTAIYLGLGSVM
jgi:Na+/H+ antiporter NhaC